MNRQPVAQSSITRNFLIEADDLVDEILSALKKYRWSDVKMKYELGTLSASVVEKKGEHKTADSTYVLSCKWEEQEEEVELTLSVETQSTESAPEQCQKYCQELMDSLFADSAFRRVSEASASDSQ